MNKKILIAIFSMFMITILFISIISAQQQQNPPPKPPQQQEQQKNALFFPQPLTPFAIMVFIALILFYWFGLRRH